MRPTDLYDRDIERAAAQWLPFLDWRWLKAQLYCESLLDPTAVSPVGALGIGQIMPNTWPEIREGLGLPHSASQLDAENGIAGAAWYDRKLWNAWRAPRGAYERIRLMFASYNAGFGNMLAAQTEAHGASASQPILDALHLITGEANAKQTRDYVARITDTYERLLQGK